MDPEPQNPYVSRISLMPVGGNQTNIIRHPTWINFFRKSYPWKKVTRTVHFAFYEGANRTLRISFFRNDDIPFIDKKTAEKWLETEIRVPDIELVGQPIIDKVLFVIRKETCHGGSCDYRSLSKVLEIDFHGPQSVINANVIRCPASQTKCPDCGCFLDVSYVPN